MFIRVLYTLLALILVSPAMAQDRQIPQSQQQMQLSFAPLVKKVSPAVVNIFTKRTVTRRASNPFMSDPFFRRFFNNNAFGGSMREQVESSLGSGVIVEPNGLVITNAHVVKDATEIKIVLADGREFDADLALRDEPSDLALLRIQEKNINLPYVTLRPSETLEVGDIVLAIGNPFGVGQTVTSGIVSAKARSTLNISDFNFFLQTDAAINPGNSGGPLVALDGGVVGINSAIYSRDGGSLGIGFAIPSEMVATVIAAEKMGRTGEEGVIRPWLGITSQNVTAEMASSLGMEKPAGALVAKLHSASPLLEAGIQVGDAILSINGTNVRDSQELKFRMATVPIGEFATFEVSRQGKRIPYKVKAIAPPDSPPRETTTLKGNHPLNGAVIANLNPALIQEYGLNVTQEEGVIILKIQRGVTRINLEGNALLEINGASISNVEDALKALKSPMARGWSFLVDSGGRTRQIMVR